MRLTDIFASIVSKLSPSLPQPIRPVSTPEDVRWQRRRMDVIKREAEMLGADTSLERAGDR